MKVQEFYTLTPGEFNALVQGWLWRHRHEEDKAARWIAAILNGAGHLKKAVSPAELLNRPLQPLLPTTKG